MHRCIAKVPSIKDLPTEREYERQYISFLTKSGSLEATHFTHITCNDFVRPEWVLAWHYLFFFMHFRIATIRIRTSWYVLSLESTGLDSHQDVLTCCQPRNSSATRAKGKSRLKVVTGFPDLLRWITYSLVDNELWRCIDALHVPIEREFERRAGKPGCHDNNILV